MESLREGNLQFSRTESPTKALVESRRLRAKCTSVMAKQSTVVTPVAMSLNQIQGEMLALDVSKQ